MSQACPIFKKDGERLSLIGVWLQFPQNVDILPTSVLFADLGDNIGAMAARYIETEEWHRIENTETECENGVKFVAGAFLMGTGNNAPNRDRDRDAKYILRDQDGIAILVREV